MSFLESADPERCNTLWSSLRKNSLTSADHYPKALTDSFNLLSHYRPLVKNTIPLYVGGNQRGKNVQFTQVKGTD